MARYFYHVSNGIGYFADAEGQELPTGRTIRDVALLSVRSLISEEVKSGVIDLRGTIEVTDDSGATLLVMPFQDAVEISA